MPQVWDQQCSFLIAMTNSRFVSCCTTLKFRVSILTACAVPAEALNNYTPSKRSLSVNDIAARDYPQGQMGQVGDRPWFCWFNQTILEFFIYLDQNITSSSTPTTAFSPYPTSMYNYGVGSSPTVSSYPGNYPSSQPSWATQNGRRDHNSEHNQGYSPDPQYTTNYPFWIKMEEKRKPKNDIQPYCQQMRILDNGLIVPQEDVQIINISEIEPGSSNNQKRDGMYGSTTVLDSNCVCEWLATT